MSLELAAQHLASRGRKGDSMLVHMAPEEVSGLQALARAGGGTLTLNPDTGLPEANFLKRMLPMIIGAGITAATGGAAAPWMVGLGMGGLETVRTGSLEKGLMAGLGAYGGAGLAGGLMGAGNAAASQAASAANPSFVGPMPGAASGASALGAGIQNLGTAGGPSAALSAMGGGAQAAKYGLAALSPAMQAEAAKPYDGGGPNPYEYDYDPNNQMYTRVAPGTRARDMLAPTTPMMAAGGPIQDMSDRNQMQTMMANGGQMFAAGGQINLQGTLNVNQAESGGGGQFGQANANGYQAAGGGMGGFDPRAVQANPQGFAQHMAQMQQREMAMPGSTMLTQGFAAGGVSHLGDYSDGGRLLKGPGDGVSDSIPATIANKRPARLADGEFVVPARIVSELGNGSTEAGARKLYAMMDRVQKARGKTTGKGRVAVNSRADKLLPA
jgi:hypothetical protein